MRKTRFAIIAIGFVATTSCVHDDRAVSALSPTFLARAESSEMMMPTAAQIAAAASRDTEYARYDSFVWQKEVLAETARAVPAAEDLGVRDIGRLFTPAVSTRGEDSVYHLWEAQGRLFQFRSSSATFYLGIGPREPRKQPPMLGPAQIEAQVRAMVAAAIREGGTLLAFAHLEITPHNGGLYGVLFRVDDADKANLASALDQNRSIPEAPNALSWIYRMRVITDGESFLFEIPKTRGALVRKNEMIWFGPRR